MILKPSRSRKFLLILLALSLFSGCSKFLKDLRPTLPNSEDSENPAAAAVTNPESGTDSEGKAQPKVGKRARRDDFIDQSQEEGSLWASSGQTNYYFTKNKIRSPGDIVTLKIENDLYRGIISEVKTSFTAQEQTFELNEARNHLRNHLMKYAGGSAPLENADRLTTSAAAPEKVVDAASPSPTPNPEGVVSAPISFPSGKIGINTVEEIEKQVMQLGFADVDIAPGLEIKSGDIMMGEIAGRYPNGNYKIRATKKVLYKKGQAREVAVIAIVKAGDIGEDTDIVNSGKLYDYQIEVTH